MKIPRTRLIVDAREALDRFHRVARFLAEVVDPDSISKEAAAAVDAYRDGKRRESDPSCRASSRDLFKRPLRAGGEHFKQSSAWLRGRRRRKY